MFEENRAAVMKARLLVIEGELQREDGVTHIIAKSMKDASTELLRLSEDDAQQNEVDGFKAEADKIKDALPPYRSGGHPRNVKGLVPKSRDFH